MPLENSVWGLPQSSGCFSTLFESRLIKALEYAKAPFEIKTENGNAEKIFCSSPLDIGCCDSWDSLCRNERGVLVLNGDSSHLPVPDCSADAVITDPPYFDFVNYSELSDFFYAWLSPALGGDYGYFRNGTSRRGGEVQNSDPILFSRSLGKVFSECARVLKDGGTLAFSFHHPEPEAWAAVGSALSESGFCVSEVYPVHGEMSRSNRKARTADPINIDAVLFCRKRGDADSGISAAEAAELSSEWIDFLVSEGITLSAGDTDVIFSAHFLSVSTAEGMDYGETLGLLGTCRRPHCSGDGTFPPENVPVPADSISS